MRKKLWGCAVAAALAALGGGLAVDYACDHPDSWPGRWLFTARATAVSRVTTLEAAARPAEVVRRGMQVLLGPGTSAACEGAGGCAAPKAGAVADECPAAPAVLPGGVVMHEDAGQLPAQPMPPVHDFVGGLPAAGDGEECDEAPMPRAEDDAPKMPRAEESDEDCHCPHASRKADAKPAPDTTREKMERSGAEECEPVSPKLRRDGGEAPRHPDVDTMEARPSDLRFLDFTGPF
ncbi:MAG TPA: hypothetical protein VFA26_03155 [Gemmataceae bacterium]|nr:hypothetical protein [Gemmataceae bacterium]